METRTARRSLPIALCATALFLGASCGGSPAAPTPVATTETFTRHAPATGSRLQDLHHHGAGNERSQRHRQHPQHRRGRDARDRHHHRCGIRRRIRWDLCTAGAERRRGPRAGAVRPQRRLDRKLLRAGLRLSDGSDRLHICADRARDLLDDRQTFLSIHRISARASRQRQAPENWSASNRCVLPSRIHDATNHSIRLDHDVEQDLGRFPHRPVIIGPAEPSSSEPPFRIE